MFQVKSDVCVYADGASPPHTRQSSCNISAAEVVVEFKWEPHHNPFHTPAGDPSPTSHFISETDKAMDTLGQIMSYTTAQLGTQYCTHTFSILIIYDQAYIIRWDREGATVSSAIKYNEEPHLADFFHRYAQASPALHGVDTSVTSASTEEAALARLQLGLSATTCMLKVAVPHVNDSGSITLIFPAPVPVGQPPIGQCTRTCPAYDIGNDRAVMFKNSWRVAIANILPEGETYKILKKQCFQHCIMHCVSRCTLYPSTSHADLQTCRCCLGMFT
jgi:hypothetical protein